MIFTQHLNSSKENIDLLVQNPGLIDFFNNAPDVKIITSKTVFKFTSTFTNTKGTLNKAGKNILQNLKSSPLSDKLIYDKNMVGWQEVGNVTTQFNGSKLHWLTNDIKKHGISYPPQGYMQDELFVCHPGTYRFTAAFAQQINTEMCVWDTDNIFDKPALTLREWIDYCSNGFVRKNRYITLKTDDIEDRNRRSNLRYLEIHETMNHHDHYIINQDTAMREMFNHEQPTVFCPSVEVLNKVKSVLDDPSLYNFAIIDNKFLIPSTMNFKGVGIYIGDINLVQEDFSEIVLYLDINDDVCYVKGIDLVIFNNSTHNCKILIPEIVHESSEEYLQNFYWTSKVSLIPNEIGDPQWNR